MTEYGYNLLGRLSEIFAPAGCEDAVVVFPSLPVTAYIRPAKSEQKASISPVSTAP